MQIYLVGGAVRDKFLGLPVKEQDWVVVGATPEDLLAAGYRPVGKDFPVFLHPTTHEEYALARTERKVRKGYTGFVFHASPEVTLEQDLLRRDLTINAMAMKILSDGHYELIDPYGGERDLKNRILRHVSPAFVEDPVRILRLARFAARYQHLGFTVAPETVKLMQDIVAAGEVDALVPERVWQEFAKVLAEPGTDCQEFFKVLQQAGALQKLFPEFLSAKKIKNINNNFLLHAHPEICFARLILGFFVREDRNKIQQLCARYRIPKNYAQMALLACELQAYFCFEKSLSAEEILSVCDKADAWRRPQRFLLLLEVFAHSQNAQQIRRSFEAAAQISAQSVKMILHEEHEGKALGDAIHALRLTQIKNSME